MGKIDIPNVGLTFFTRFDIKTREIARDLLSSILETGK